MTSKHLFSPSSYAQLTLKSLKLAWGRSDLSPYPKVGTISKDISDGSNPLTQAIPCIEIENFVLTY